MRIFIGSISVKRISMGGIFIRRTPCIAVEWLPVYLLLWCRLMPAVVITACRRSASPSRKGTVMLSGTVIPGVCRLRLPLPVRIAVNTVMTPGICATLGAVTLRRVVDTLYGIAILSGISCNLR
jgi:hypothetical protein